MMKKKKRILRYNVNPKSDFNRFVESYFGVFLIAWFILLVIIVVITGAWK